MIDEIKLSRIRFDTLGENYPRAAGVLTDKEVIETIDCYWFRITENADNSKIVIYLHGGCFVFGSYRSHQPLVSHLAKALELPFLFVEYSLAPEKPYPNALNELQNIYRKLLHQYPGSKLILMGDSAGGWLSVALISKIYELGLQPPEFCILISPWIDLSCSSKSITENADKDPVLKKSRLLELASLYIGKQNLSIVNPLDTPNGKFPATLILVGSNEILLDDSRLIFNKISRFQPRAKLSIYENQNHVWLLDNIYSEHSQNAIGEIKAFLMD